MNRSKFTVNHLSFEIYFENVKISHEVPFDLSKSKSQIILNLKDRGNNHIRVNYILEVPDEFEKSDFEEYPVYMYSSIDEYNSAIKEYYFKIIISFIGFLGAVLGIISFFKDFR